MSSLVGLDWIRLGCYIEAINVFLTDSTATNIQVEFVKLIVGKLTKNGAMEDGCLCQSPFVDINLT